MADKSKWKGKNLSYMTPQMMHALKMSQTQSQVRTQVHVMLKCEPKFGMNQLFLALDST